MTVLPLSGLLSGELQPAEKKKVTAVECAACGRLHKYDSFGWIVLHGKWSAGQQSSTFRAPFAGKTFGSSDDPTIVCDSDFCILKAMGRGDSD